MSYAIFLRSVVCPVILNEGGRSCFYGATFGSSLRGGPLSLIELQNSVSLKPSHQEETSLYYL